MHSARIDFHPYVHANTAFHAHAYGNAVADTDPYADTIGGDEYQGCH